MKKLLKTFVIFALMLCTCFTFVACKNDDGKGEQKANAEEAFNVLKSSVTKLNNASQKGGSFTILKYSSYNDASKVNENKFSPVGLSEDDKKSVIEMTNKNFTDENNDNKRILSYDSQNNTAYEANYTIDDKKEKLEEYRLWEKENESDQYYLYDYCLDRHEGEDLKERKRFGADSEYCNNYLLDFSDFAEEMQEYADNKSLKDLQMMLIDMTEMDIEDFAKNCKSVVSVTKEGNDYVLKINITYSSDSVLIDELENLDFLMTVNTTILFNQNTFKSIESNSSIQSVVVNKITLTNEQSEEVEVEIPIDITRKYDYKQEFLDSYTSEFKPNLSQEEKAQFEDCGNVRIDICYYINGYSSSYFMTKSLGDSCDDIGIVDLENAKNVVWYTDRECTKPFTKTTYPSYDLWLYSKDVKPAEGKAFLFEEWIDSEKEISNFVYGIRVTNINMGKVDADRFEYAILNGTRIEAGEDIVLDNSIVNKLYYVRKAEIE